MGENVLKAQTQEEMAIRNIQNANALVIARVCVCVVGETEAS